VIKIKFSTLFFLLVAIHTFGQQKNISGKITNDKEVEGIHILNTTSRYNAITDQNGNFSITVNKKDTLLFSSVNFFPEKIVITEEIIENGIITITLKELLNELDEVFLGHQLSGNIQKDLENINTKKPFNFDDVGIPGFKGKPEEKIVPIVPYLGLATAVDLEAMYKHLSGYYKKLRLKRKWDGQNNTTSHIINFYTPTFFYEAFKIPENRLYDFILFCIETTSLQDDYDRENFVSVLQIFKTKSAEYLLRIEKKEE